jgi:hypothetical protein
MKRWLAVMLLGTLAGGVLWLVTPRKPVTAVEPLPEPASTTTSPGRAESPPSSAEIEAPPEDAVATTDAASSGGAVPVAPPQVALAALAEPPVGPEPVPGLTPVTLLENVRSAFRHFSSRFGGNPVGTNQEITRMLTGDNPGHATFLQPEDGLRVNDRGELVDCWGTPFFFHQLSRTEMEIHSAGPDRKLWTADDLVLK